MATSAAFTATVSAITDAFGDPTRRDIYLFARDAEGVTATQVAERFGLHPNVARHHLDKLAAGGYLEVAVERTEGAGAGRPSKRYRVADATEVDVPVHSEDLVLALLGRTLALLPREQAESMAEEVGQEYGRAMAASLTGTTDTGTTDTGTTDTGTTPTDTGTPTAPTGTTGTSSTGTTTGTDTGTGGTTVGGVTVP